MQHNIDFFHPSKTQSHRYCRDFAGDRVERFLASLFGLPAGFIAVAIGSGFISGLLPLLFSPLFMLVFWFALPWMQKHHTLYGLTEEQADAHKAYMRLSDETRANMGLSLAEFKCLDDADAKNLWRQLCKIRAVEEERRMLESAHPEIVKDVMARAERAFDEQTEYLKTWKELA